jgi:hypothetical protein
MYPSWLSIYGNLNLTPHIRFSQKEVETPASIEKIYIDLILCT